MSKDILIVDDEKPIRDSIARHYRLKGYEVDTAENGLDALDKLSQDSYKAVVTDIRMPEMDGVELLGRVRDECPLTRCIVITGYVTLGNALAAIRQGADACIFKPIEDMQELDMAVEHAIKSITDWKSKLKMLRGLKPE